MNTRKPKKRRLSRTLKALIAFNVLVHGGSFAFNQYDNYIGRHLTTDLNSFAKNQQLDPRILAGLPKEIRDKIKVYKPNLPIDEIAAYRPWLTSHLNSEDTLAFAVPGAKLCELFLTRVMAKKKSDAPISLIGDIPIEAGNVSAEDVVLRAIFHEIRHCMPENDFGPRHKGITGGHPSKEADAEFYAIKQVELLKPNSDIRRLKMAELAINHLLSHNALVLDAMMQGKELPKPEDLIKYHKMTEDADLKGLEDIFKTVLWNKLLDAPREVLRIANDIILSRKPISADFPAPVRRIFELRAEGYKFFNPTLYKQADKLAKLYHATKYPKLRGPRH